MIFQNDNKIEIVVFLYLRRYCHQASIHILLDRSIQMIPSSSDICPGLDMFQGARNKVNSELIRRIIRITQFTSVHSLLMSRQF